MKKRCHHEGLKEHHVDVLVSTTVIEVGANVPNATVMVIMDAIGLVLANFTSFEVG